MSYQPGSLVRYREREWVVLPSERPELILLRPLGGSSREITGVPLSFATTLRHSLPHEGIDPAQFPLPTAESIQDHTAVQLMQQAARLLLREGAAPFRSLGHLSVRPRPYQYVPLLMALRQEIVRLLIADDVGVGKTIEAGLIARELLDRGIIRRIAILCPPYLCDQWQEELASKFNIEAVVMRSGTVARLDRLTPPDKSIFQFYPHFVASIDTVKNERYRAAFLQHCPNFVIVDEVHGAAAPPGDRSARAQQQRHDLLQELAAHPNRHLVLLSATPHSGVESAFLSLLGLLRPAFTKLNLVSLSADERTELAQHFVQRRRADVQNWMGADTHFPERDTQGAEQPYIFSQEYRSFYNDVYAFARELVQSAETLTGWRKRMRFWSALALLRCATSSPAAAEVALRRRLDQAGDAESADLLDETGEGLDIAFTSLIYDPTDSESSVDAPPGHIFEVQAQDPDWRDSDRRRLRDFARRAATLSGATDSKLQKLIAVITDMLRDGYRPIVWCRYIATADYVAAALQQALDQRSGDLKVTSATGAISEDERRLKVAELVAYPRHILVATDCLSEGINLQEHFDAVVHYDLPWNPNRLEQREGRVDRFGQQAQKIRAVLIFGQDNPVDGAVLDVLLRKARDIYQSLGVRVPLPAESETIMEAVLNSLFHQSQPVQVFQLSLFDAADPGSQLVQRVHAEWTRAAAREKESRTRFAQRAIRPEEVEQELRESDRVLGSPDEVVRFLQMAAERLHCVLQPVRRPGLPVGARCFHLPPSTLPPVVALRLGHTPNPWPITVDSPSPEGFSYVGRNHPLIEGLAEYVLDLAFHPTTDGAPAARVGVVRTAQVRERTTLLLLRLRYLLYEREDGLPTLAEETLTWGFTGWTPGIKPLTPEAAQRLLDETKATGNVVPAEKQAWIDDMLGEWVGLQPHLAQIVQQRVNTLETSHSRVRRITRRQRIRVEPQLPADLLGLVVLLPVVGGQEI